MIRVGCGVDVLADPGNNPRATTICLFVIGLEHFSSNCRLCQQIWSVPFQDHFLEHCPLVVALWLWWGAWIHPGRTTDSKKGGSHLFFSTSQRIENKICPWTLFTAKCLSCVALAQVADVTWSSPGVGTGNPHNRAAKVPKPATSQPGLPEQDNLLLQLHESNHDMQDQIQTTHQPPNFEARALDGQKKMLGVHCNGLTPALCLNKHYNGQSAHAVFSEYAVVE